MQDEQTQGQKLPAVLGAWTALAAIVGSVIGSGIFLVPAKVANGVPFVGGIVAVWLIGGLFSAAGALTLAELGAMMPRAGGPYEYLKRGFGPLSGFLFSWAEFWVVRTGSMATLAAAFATYFSQLMPPVGGISAVWWQAMVAIMAMAVVGLINVKGTRHGARFQVVGTMLKIMALSTMILLPLILGKGTAANWSPVGPDAAHPATYTGFLAAMVAVLWAYDGWVNVTPLAEELTNPQKQLPRALAGGIVILIVLYLGTTLAYHAVLPLDLVRGASTVKGSPKVVAAEFWQVLIGPAGVTVISHRDGIDIDLIKRQCSDRPKGVFCSGSRWLCAEVAGASEPENVHPSGFDHRPDTLGHHPDLHHHNPDCGRTFREFRVSAVDDRSLDEISQHAAL
jgi:APA family basic amino acid/polyamine antiporter